MISGQQSALIQDFDGDRRSAVGADGQGKRVLEFIGEGLTNWQIAERMFLARKDRHE